MYQAIEALSKAYVSTAVASKQPADWRRWTGALKNSPHLNDDPVAIQQAMRHEWIEFLLDTNMVIGLLKGHMSAVTLAEQSGFALDKTSVSQITGMGLLGYPQLNACAIVAATAITFTLRLLTLDQGMSRGFHGL